MDKGLLSDYSAVNYSMFFDVGIFPAPENPRPYAKGRGLFYESCSAVVVDGGGEQRVV